MPSTEDPNSTISVGISEDTDTSGQSTMATKNGTQDQPNTQRKDPAVDVLPENAKSADTKPASSQSTDTATADPMPKEYGGPAGLEPTRYGDWEKNGRCSDF